MGNRWAVAVALALVTAGCDRGVEPAPAADPQVTPPPDVAMTTPVSPGSVSPAPVAPLPSPLQCVPADCLSLNAMCGEVPDGCGGQLSCGGCAPDRVCGGPRLHACHTPNRRFVELSPVGATTCALADDHSLWCWGSGIGAAPRQLGSDHDWKSVSTPCALKTSGALWCLGPSGQLVQIATPHTDWTTLSGSDLTRCGSRPDGSLWCWGSLLADPRSGTELVTSATPVQVEAPTAWRDVRVDEWSLCAISMAGKLSCWAHFVTGPKNGGGGSMWTTRVQTASSDWTRFSGRGCAVRASGDVWCWNAHELAVGGSSDPGARYGTSSDWPAVESSGRNRCGRRSDSTLWCQRWSYAYPGAEGTGWSITAPERIGDTADWSTLALGDAHGCALRSDGTSWCWGSNAWGQLGTGVTGGSGPRRIAPQRLWKTVDAVGLRTFALAADGSLWGWDDRHGIPRQLGTDTDWVTLTRGHALKSDGSLWRLTLSEPVRVGDQRWKRVALAFFGDACGIQRDGSLWCWGPSTTVLPARVGTFTDWVDVTVASARACGLRADGSRWCWGSTFGSTPVPSGAGPWSQLCDQYDSTCGLRDDGTVVCSDSYRTTPIMTPTGPLVASSLACGYRHACAVAIDGTLRCWGENYYSELMAGSATDWTSATAGHGFTCGLRGTGALFCFGSAAALGDGTGYVDIPQRVSP